LVARDADIGGWNNPTLIYFFIFTFVSGFVIMKLRVNLKNTEVMGTTYNYLAKRLDKFTKGSKSPERNRKESDDNPPLRFPQETETASLGLRRNKNTAISMPNLARFHSAAK